MKPVGKPDAGNPHVRFDERGWETGRSHGQHPRPSSTLPPVFFGRLDRPGGLSHVNDAGAAEAVEDDV